MNNDVEHPDAYAAAIRNRIKANASKTRRRNWLATHPDAQRLWDWLYRCGEFESRFKCGAVIDGFRMHECEMGEKCSGAGAIAHPTTVGMFAGNFGETLAKMREAVNEWGGLTDKQTDLVRRALARAEDRVATAAARREERIAADRATSSYVGVVGERREFDLVCERFFAFEGVFGFTYINIFRDAERNIVVYKGSRSVEEGDAVRVKATVKAHEEREGVKQTVIARPTFLESKTPEAAA